MSVTKTAAVLLVVGLIVGVGIGYGIGFMFYQPEISRLNTDLSSARSEIDGLETQVSSLKSERSDLETQVSSLTSQVSTLTSERSDLQTQVSSLTSEVSALQSDLDDALGKATTLETKISAIKEASVQLNKDLVFLETFHKLLTTETEIALEEILALWSDVRESSGDVDPALPSKVDVIMDDAKAVFDWVERAPWDGTLEEVSLWQSEGMVLIGQYQADYYAFETVYISAIQSHIKAATELTES